MRKVIRGCLLLSIAMLAAPVALAQTWPTKPVRFINPFPAGGGVDVFARPIAAKLTPALGQQVIVENLSGAGGTVGAATASRAPADGYTFFMGAVHHAIAETLYTKLPYNIEKSFAAVTVVAFVPNAVIVHPKHPFRSLSELISFAKANPDKLNFGSAGNGTAHHLAGELFETTTNTHLVHIPFKGAGPMMSDLLGGQVDMAFDTLATSGQHVKSGKLRALAVTTAKRSPLLPDVPTMAEAGVPNYVLSTWYAMWAIGGTPKPIADRVHGEVLKVLASPEVREISANQGAESGGMSRAEFAGFLHDEILAWGKVVKAAGAKIDI